MGPDNPLSYSQSKTDVSVHEATSNPANEVKSDSDKSTINESEAESLQNEEEMPFLSRMSNMSFDESSGANSKTSSSESESENSDSSTDVEFIHGIFNFNYS